MGKEGFIYLLDNNIILAKKEVVASEHHHHAIKVAINLNKGAEVYINERLIEQNTIILNADLLHSFNSYSNPLIFLLINPESEIGTSIRKKYLVESDSFFSDFNYTSHMVNHFNDFSSAPQSKTDVQHFYNDVINFICGKSIGSFTIDSRINDIFNKMSTLEDKKLPVKELASQVFLSESRFAHLFKEETRIPVRQYLAWLRLLDGLRLIVKGYSFTDAALESGFTDLPHLHKTFTHFLGVKLSDYFKNSRFIQVIDYGSS